MRAPPLPEGTPACRILSWNVAGLRALLKKVKEVESGARQENIPSPLALAEAEAADVLCLQARVGGWGLAPHRLLRRSLCPLFGGLLR